MIHLTPQARTKVREDEVPVLDWHRVAIRCARAGGVSVDRGGQDDLPDAVLGRGTG